MIGSFLREIGRCLPRNHVLKELKLHISIGPALSSTIELLKVIALEPNLYSSKSVYLDLVGGRQYSVDKLRELCYSDIFKSYEKDRLKFRWRKPIQL